jgi:PAS domain S-box-containing protein
MSFLKRFLIRVRLTFIIFLGAIVLMGIVFLYKNVIRDLRLLNSASSDNLQWALSQIEVEFLDFSKNIVTKSMVLEPELSSLRLGFDVFYSRITTLQQASIYAPLHELSHFSDDLRIVQAFLDRAVKVIDAKDDSLLIKALPTLIDQSVEIRGNIRRLSNSGLTYFAEESDRRRKSVANTLSYMAGGASVLIVALLLFAVYFRYLNTQNIKRRAEANNASSRMKIVTDTALDGVIVSDNKGQILEFNAAAEQIFGYTAKNAIGCKIDDLIVSDHYRFADEAGIKNLLEGGERTVFGKGRIKLDGIRSNGEIFPVEFAIQSAKTEEGEIFVAFLRDISNSVEAERELVMARDLALAGEKAQTNFLATMSHEIRTPLNGLLGNLALLRDTRLSGKQISFVKNMDTSGKLLMRHISYVLDITKYDAGKLRLQPVEMNLSTLLQDIIDNQGGAASANGTTLEWGWIGPKVDWIFGDRDRIQHILMNVIGNAVKFTHKGRVVVELEVNEELHSNPILQISISDTGIGMDPDLQAQIFDDFLTGDASYERAVGGTGLGLGLAQRFVKALGGNIEVQSKKGAGSTFRISFSIKPISVPEVVVERHVDNRNVRSSQILLVEDNEINRVVAREMLLSAGHKVTEAYNGQEAVDLAAAHYFDIIFMDISMPVMDGRVATRAIRSGNGVCGKTPIVALTASAMPEEQEAFLSDGINDILTKPLSKESLLHVVAQHVMTLECPAADADKQSSPFDAAHLDDLCDILGVDTMETLLERFRQEVNSTLDYLNDHAGHSFSEIAEQAHRIAGSAATFGATALQSALIEVEQATKKNDVARMEGAIAALPKVWRVTRPLLQVG